MSLIGQFSHQSSLSVHNQLFDTDGVKPRALPAPISLPIPSKKWLCI